MAEETSGIWICRGVNTRYQARARWPGYRRYQLIGKASRSYRVALRRMAGAFATGNYHRADVLISADYYDPEMVCELTRR